MEFIKRNLKDKIGLILVLVLSIFAVLPLFHQGFFTFHDDQQVARLFELDKALMSGQFPVRWVSDLGFGYGYPLFNFYPPFIYYFGEVFHLLGWGFIDSIKIVWGLALVLSGLSMYFLARNLFGKMAGIVAGLFYVYAPYHAVDAYVRGALAELFSFVWLPLILLFVYKKKPVIAGLFLGMLMITHNLIFLPFFGFFAVWSIVFHRKSLIISPLVAFGLTAFFWLPALAEKQYTLVDQTLIRNLASYKIHFVCIQQFFYSPWGFGGSVAGCNDGMSFMVGKIYLMLVVIGLILGIWKRSLLVMVSCLLFVFSGFMATGYSQIIWDQIPQLWYLQFPWRFMEFLALFSAIIAGGAISLLPLNKWIKTIFAAVVILALIPNVKYFSPQKYTDVSDKDLTNSQIVKWHVSSTSFEYLPKEIETHVNELGNVWVNIDESQVAESNYNVTTGQFISSSEKFSPGKFILEGISSGESTLQFSTTYFPGWTLKVDGVKTEIIRNNPYNLITVSISSGKHKIEGYFDNTLVRSIGNSISVFFIVLLIIYAARRGKK